MALGLYSLRACPVRSTLLARGSRSHVRWAAEPGSEAVLLRKETTRFTCLRDQGWCSMWEAFSGTSRRAAFLDDRIRYAPCAANCLASSSPTPYRSRNHS